MVAAHWGLQHWMGSLPTPRDGELIPSEATPAVLGCLSLQMHFPMSPNVPEPGLLLILPHGGASWMKAAPAFTCKVWAPSALESRGIEGSKAMGLESVKPPFCLGVVSKIDLGSCDMDTRWKWPMVP